MQNQGITTKLHQGINKRKNATGQENNRQCHPLQDKSRNVVHVPKEGKPKRQLNQAHLEGAHYHNGMWQHVKKLIDEQINMQMDKQYKKLDNLANKSNTQQSKYQKRIKETNREQQQRIVKLTIIKLTQEQKETLSLGPKHATEKETKYYISHLIIDTENAIRKLEHMKQNAFRHFAKKQIKIISNSKQKKIYSINDINTA